MDGLGIERLKLRSDTAANWAAANPVLAASEPALETDTGKLKVGDGVTAYVDLPAYLDETSLSATYGTHRLWLPAELMQPGTGVGGALATRTHLGNRWNAWLVDAANVERLTTGLDVPAGWELVNVDLFWSNAGAGAGDISISAYLTPYGDGDSTGKGVTTVTFNAVLTAPAQNILKVSRIATGVAVTPGLLSEFMIDRQASAAADTLANDAAFIGVLLSRSTPT